MTKEQLELLYQSLDDVCKAYGVAIRVVDGQLRAEKFTSWDDCGFKVPICSVSKVGPK